MVIGLSGAQGSFSEQATQEYCRKNKIEKAEFSYLISVKNVLDALRDNKIDLGIFPIENSNGGIVIESIYAMADHIFKIQDLFEIPVLHCLMAKHGIKKEDIEMIASHDQALKQCKMYLRRQWPHVALQETSDTAGTAKNISE